MNTKIFLLLICLFSLVSCTKEDNESKSKVEVIVHQVNDTSYFDIEQVDLSVFKDGSRNGVTPATIIHLTSLSRDNYLIAFNGKPREHDIFAHALINYIDFRKMSPGTAMLTSNGQQIEVANYRVTFYYNDGTTEVFVGDLAPYYGDNYTYDPSSSLIHPGSNTKRVTFVLNSQQYIPGYNYPYRPQTAGDLYYWKEYFDGVLKNEISKTPEDFSSNLWKPKHRV